MYSKYAVILSFFTLFTCFSQERKLVWEEQFNGSELDTSVWNFELGNGCPDNCGWGNNERQFYTKVNHRLENGKLIITARERDSSYTSTRITTKGKKEFKYGRMEARAKLPTGQGIWPAFWMLGADIGEVGWPDCGEIDIMEYVGREPHTAYTTIHTRATHGENASSEKTTLPNIEEGFHIYAVDWTADAIKFYVDDDLLYTYAPEEHTKAVWPFDQPFFFLINIAVGGNFGGPEVDDSIFPQEYIVDWVKVYQ